jgi:hypothetical protein
MTPAELLADSFGRIRDGVHRVLRDLDEEALTFRPGPDANTIAWLVWHLTRVQDDHVAEVAGTDQVWTAQGYAERFGLPFDQADTGFGHSSAEVAQVRTGAALLREYSDAVVQACLDYVATIEPSDLDRIVDERWDPPVSLGVRLVSVIGDDLQHLGQASYVRGVWEAR